MAETIFADGISVFDPSPKAPEFIKLDVSINPERLAAWARANKQYVSDKGYIKLQVMRSKQKETLYIAVNTFVPQQQNVPKQPSGEPYPMDEHGAVAAYEQEAMSHTDLVPESELPF